MNLNSGRMDQLQSALGKKLQVNVPLGGFTSSRIGGKADGLVIVNTLSELEHAVTTCWQLGIPCRILGNASNVLISDQGYRGVVIINRAKAIHFEENLESPFVTTSSGTNLGGLARQAAIHGFSGLEWAAFIPGTVGGAVYGNAGAHGSDIQSCLIMAEILHQNNGRESWNCEQLGFTYRSSVLKRTHAPVVILSAQFRLTHSTKEEVQARMDTFNDRRRKTQPPGASMGSMFKNPSGDHAGRLIEAAGLKGTRIGGVEISPMHANFFVNQQDASASDVVRLIRLVQKTVKAQFDIELELEIELLGEWNEI